MFFHLFIWLLASPFTGSLSAQWIYSQGFAANTNAPELQRINLNNNAFVRLTGMADMGDIAFHPDNRLMGVVFDKVYSIDTLSPGSTEIYDIGDFQSVGMTIDYKGIMYFSGYNPNTNRFGIAIFNPATSVTRIVADFGPINQGFINDLEFYNGELYVVGELPSTFSERAVLFRVDTTGSNQHDTIATYQMWPGRALASISDSCSSRFLVSPATSLLNFFDPPLDTVEKVDIVLSDGLFYSSGATSRTANLGSIPHLVIKDVSVKQDPCLGHSNADIDINLLHERPSAVEYSLDGINYQPSSKFINLVPGQYVAYARDRWGCSHEFTFEILLLNAFPVTIDIAPSSCGMNNGVIAISSLVNGFRYSLNQNPFIDDGVFIGLSGGHHVLMVMNTQGCVDTIELILDAFGPPSFDCVVVDEKCKTKDGVIELHAVTGQMPLMYSLNGTEWQASFAFTGLGAGMYTVFVRDKFGCISQKDVSVGEFGQPIINNIDIEDAGCGEINGEIVVHATSSNSELVYSLDGIFFTADSVFAGLWPDHYSITVMDGNGCTTSQAFQVVTLGGPEIEEITVIPESCGQHNGTIRIEVISDHEPLLFQLDGGTQSNSGTFTGLAPGEYLISVEDSNGCISYAYAEIIAQMPVDIDEVTLHHTTCGLNNGRVVVHNDQALDLTYSLDGIHYQVSNEFENLAEGLYTIFLLSYDLCVDSASLIIEGSLAPAIQSITIHQPTCDSEPASISVSAHGNALSYKLDTQPLNDSGIFPEIMPGVYSLSVLDQYGCAIDTVIHIIAPDCSLYIPNVFSPNGDGINDLFSAYDEKSNLEWLRFEIFDRWGNCIYKCEDATDCAWDGMTKGQLAPDGVYLYAMSYLYNNMIRHLGGQVTIVK